MRPYSRSGVLPLAVAAVLGTVAWGTASAGAAVLSVQFRGTGQPVYDPTNTNANAIAAGYTTLTPGVGVQPVLSSTFNITPLNSGSGTMSIVTDTGETGSTLTYSSAGTYNTQVPNYQTNVNTRLLTGYLDDDDGAASSAFTVTNLPADIAGAGSTPYIVDLYIAGDNAGRGGNLTVNGTTYTIADSGPTTSGQFVLATAGTGSTTQAFTGTLGNYFEVTTTGTTLTVSTQGINFPNSGNARLPLDGFQIASVPEPASVGLLGLCTVGLLRRRARSS